MSNITFYVGIQGLPTSVDLVLSEHEWNKGGLPANYSWQKVTVKYPEDQHKWLEAKDEWLCAAWTPNQSYEDRADNAEIMKKAERVMESLEKMAVAQ